MPPADGIRSCPDSTRSKSMGRCRAESIRQRRTIRCRRPANWRSRGRRSEEHTSEIQSLMRKSYAVCCLKKKKKNEKITNVQKTTYIKNKYKQNNNVNLPT